MPTYKIRFWVFVGFIFVYNQLELAPVNARNLAAGARRSSAHNRRHAYCGTNRQLHNFKGVVLIIIHVYSNQ